MPGSVVGTGCWPESGDSGHTSVTPTIASRGERSIRSPLRFIVRGRGREYDHLVEFYKVEPGEKVGLVRVRCATLPDQRTAVEVTYKYTALSDTGAAFIAGFTADAYEEFIAEWERLLSACFASQADSTGGAAATSAPAGPPRCSRPCAVPGRAPRAPVALPEALDDDDRAHGIIRSGRA